MSELGSCISVPCCTWPSVDLPNGSHASGAGKVLQEEHLPSEDEEEVFPLFLLSLLLGSCLWYLLLLALWEVIRLQAVGISDPCPAPPGQAPFRKSYFSPRTSFLSVLAAFHSTFTGSTRSLCLINNNVKPLRNTKALYLYRV